jgi:uncharacterized protein (TIGR04255 family)
MQRKLPKPFSGPPPAEVPLARAPLVRVIGQISFAPILGIPDPVVVAPFQERLRTTYPLLNKDIVQRIDIRPDNPASVQQETIWRFHDLERRWRMSLAPTFVALETPRYTSRRDFLTRLGDIIDALEQTLNPRFTQRIGLRYISRVEGEALPKLSEFVKPEFVGAVDTPFGHAAQYLVTESLIPTDEGMLSARWGKLPANATVDPHAIEPASTDSWVHDLDLFREEPGAFSKDELGPLLEAFAKRLYAVFRYMVTDTYLRYYGGEV